MIGLPSTTGSAQFALSDAFDAVQLPTVTLPGFTTVLVCALLCLAAAVGYLSGRMRGLAGAGRCRGCAGCRHGLPDLGGLWSRVAFPGQQPIRRHFVARYASGIWCALGCCANAPEWSMSRSKGSSSRRLLLPP